MTARGVQRARARGWFPVLACAACGFLGCAASRPLPPRAPALAVPTDAVPPDLDFVARVDLARVRSALGTAGVDLVEREAGGQATADATTKLVSDAIDHSDTAVLALRPELVPGEADNVLVLTGHFHELGIDDALRSAGWSAAVDLGGDVRRFERPGKLSRAAAARAYAFGDEGLVFASTAEIDSVEAVLERGMAPSKLAPKAKGVLAFGLRLRIVRGELERRYPILARAVGDTDRLEGSVDTTAKGLALEVSFELPSEAAATDSASALGEVRQALAASEGKMGTMAHAAEVQAVGRFVVLRAPLERGLL